LIQIRNKEEREKKGIKEHHVFEFGKSRPSEKREEKF
jgi:hypothetical protein